MIDCTSGQYKNSNINDALDGWWMYFKNYNMLGSKQACEEIMEHI